MKNNIRNLVRDTVIKAGSTFPEDKKRAYKDAMERETDERAKWVLGTLLENGLTAEKNHGPLCDDTGIPHLLLEIGEDCILTSHMLDEINLGVKDGLRALPGRPMAIMGNDAQRLDQSGGLDPKSEGVVPAPIQLRRTSGKVIRLHVLLFGGGPAIRAKTFRVFHRHNTQVVIDEIVEWAKESVALLGCTPCTLTVGIGRSHYEAAALMLQAQADGRHDVQNDLERQITERVNESGVGPMGLGGKTSVLATFLKVGPQRASGVRVVCMRPSCCFEPRIASVVLSGEDEIQPRQ